MPDPKYADLIASLFPCLVCSGTGKIWARDGGDGQVYPVKDCPLCAAGHPDVWVAGREWLKKRGWIIISHTDQADGTVYLCIGNLKGRRTLISRDFTTDTDALMDVVGQVDKMEGGKNEP